MKLTPLQTTPIVGISASDSLDACLIRNGRVEGQRVSSDDDFFAFVVKSGASLVSFSVEAQVTEGAKRIVLRSTRASALTEQLRLRGVGVIETVPGEALRLMGISDNSPTFDHLANRLRDFGILDIPLRGRWHDQGPAIVSVIVGACFWAGRFRRVGFAENEYVVIPDLEGMKDEWNGIAAIGLSGAIAAGKTTAGMHLRARGFHYARYSQVVAEVARDAGREPTPTALQEIGRELHAGLGQRWLGQKLLERLPKSGCLVIDGMRYPEDHAFMTESFGPCFRHIAITAPLDIRRDRFSRSRPGENYQEAVTHPSELGVEKVVQLAHRVIDNDGSKERFLVRFESAVSELLDKSRAPKCL